MVSKARKFLDDAAAEHRGQTVSRRNAISAMAIGTALSLGTSSPVAARSDERRHLEQAVERLRVAMVEGDGTTLDELLHAKLVYMHSSGHAQTKADLLRDLAGKRFFAALTNSDLTVDVIDRTGVVVATVDQVKNLPDGRTRASRIKVLMTWIVDRHEWRLLSRGSAIIYSPLATRC